MSVVHRARLRPILARASLSYRESADLSESLFRENGFRRWMERASLFTGCCLGLCGEVTTASSAMESSVTTLCFLTGAGAFLGVRRRALWGGVATAVAT